MPKETYLNLSREKRERVLGAAVSEFARAGYAQASVNRIVKDAGIAKGSFYQYFEDKEALFLYVFSEFTRIVKESVKAGEKDDANDFSSQLRSVVRSGLEFIDRYPEFFRFYQNILYRDDTPRRDDLLSVVRLFPHEYFQPLLVEGQKKQAIRPELSPELIVFMVNSLLESFLVEKARAKNGHIFGREGTEIDVLVDQLVDILHTGIMTGQ
ncbi:MAG: TetR/AcrR family transcriptional regulator [Proteobacteria bacterium]|nr:TetR/AcrR family transcriptional regulator [Pseudomonadota bacterium]MBU1737170.1 TetR/AcrR family transcriptional regulator [Pseudomonadota bacterium]